jgi:anti-sigma28 factor (negative regulator of flagellin synthesis)
MALTASDKKEIETIVKREIKDFLKTSTVQQFENALIEKLKKEIKNGKVKGDINELITNVMREFYKIMWTKRSFWEPSLKNA